MQQHLIVMSKVREGFDFGGCIHRSHLGGLGNRNHLGLNMVLIAQTMQEVFYFVNVDLPILARNGEQLTAREFLWSPALVGIDVGHFRADDSVMRSRDRLQSDHVSRSPSEDEMDVNRCAKMLLESLDGGLSVGIRSVAHHMSHVDRGDSG